MRVSALAMNALPLLPEKISHFFDDFHRSSRLAPRHAAHAPNGHMAAGPGQINDDLRARLPDVDVHRFVVRGVNHDLKVFAAMNSGHSGPLVVFYPKRTRPSHDSLVACIGAAIC